MAKFSPLGSDWKNGGTGNGAYIFRATSAAQVPLMLYGTTGQTANLLEAKNVSGTTVFWVTNSGDVHELGDEYITDQLTVTGNATIGGTLGVTGAATFSAGSFSGNVLITGALNVAGGVTFSADTTAKNVTLGDNNYLYCGDSQDAGIGWNTAQTADGWYFGTKTGQNTLIIAEIGDIAYDFAHAAQTNPTLYIQSATQSATQWGSLTHNQTDFLLTSGAGAVRFAPATNVTATLPATGKVLIDGTTTRTGTTECLDIDATIDTTTATDDVNCATITAARAALDTGGTRGWYVQITTGDQANGEWSYAFGGKTITSACATATSNSAVFFADTPTADAQCNDYGIYVSSGYDTAGYFDGTVTITGAVAVGDITISSTNPILNFKDTNCTDSDVNANIAAQATDTGTGAEDIDITMQQQVAGLLTTYLNSDADGSMTIGLPSQAVAFNTSALSGITTLGLTGDITISGNTAQIIHSGTTSLTIVSSSGTVLIESVTFTGGAISTATTLAMAGDLTDYEATNDGNPSWFLGAAAAERLEIQAVYDGGAQTLNYVQFQTYAASATADKGAYKFGVDGTDIFTIVDAGTTTLTSSTINRNGVLETPADGVLIYNNTAATVVLDEFSPSLRFHGSGWKTDAVAAAQNVDWRIYASAITGAAAPTSNLNFAYSINDGAFSTFAYLTSAGAFLVGAGSATLPSFSFTGDSDTGIYWKAANQIGFAINGALTSYLAAGSLYVADLLPVAATFASLRGQVADGATAIAVKLGNTIALTTAGAKIVSFRSNDVEAAYVDYLGSFNSGAGTVLLPAYSFVGDPNTGMYWVSADLVGFSVGGVMAGKIGSLSAYFNTFLANSATTVSLKGQIADGASAVGVVLDNVTALTTAGTKLVSVRNATVEKAYIDLNGGFVTLGGMIQGRQGTDIASAADATITITGNYFDITGTTQTNTLSTTGIQAGTIITLQFDGSVVVKHATAGTGAQFQLAAAADFSATAGDTLTLVFDGTVYRELARTTI